MIDTNDFVQYIVPLMFWFGFAVGIAVGILIGIIVEWRLIRRILKESDE